MFPCQQREEARSARNFSFEGAERSRGRKAEPCTVALYKDLHDVFNRARRAGVKLNASVLIKMSLELIRDAPEGSFYHTATADTCGGNLIHSRITGSWMTRFCGRCKFDNRSQTGELQYGPEKENKLNRLWSFFWVKCVAPSNGASWMWT